MDCKHNVVLKGLCCECGHDFLRGKEIQLLSESVSMIHAIPDLLVSKSEAQEIGHKERDILTKEKKLALVVDLDHTLVHSVPVNSFKYPEQVHTFADGVQLFQAISEGKRLNICFRPKVNQFLNDISNDFEIHIFTLGTRDYADQVINYIDPGKKLIGDRIRTRTECTRPDSKHLELSKIFPVGEDMVCILDDRQDVWNFSDNIIQILPFYYIKSDPDINSALFFDKNFTIQTVDKITKFCEKEGYFSHVSNWLKLVKHYYYETYEKLINGSDLDDVLRKCVNENRQPDVKNILKMIRGKILEGVTILFSGVVHTDSAGMNQLEYIAESMGAKIIDEFDQNKITHLLTPGRLTTKVKNCLSNAGIYELAHIDWLYACYYLGVRLPEKCFPYDEKNIDTNDEKISKSSQSVKETIDLTLNPRKRKISDILNTSKEESNKHLFVQDSSIYDNDPTLFEVMDELNSETEDLELDCNPPRKISKKQESTDILEYKYLIDQNESEYDDIDSEDLQVLEDALNE